jgi:type II secretion system protein N
VKVLLGRIGIALACAVLILVFLAVGFPWERLGQRLVEGAGRDSGFEIDVADLGPFVSLGGAGFEARGVKVRAPDGAAWELEQARIRPAWSSSWLRGTPTLHVEIDGDAGTVRGRWTTGNAPAFDGVLSGVDLARLPVGALAPGTDLKGILDAEIDLQHVNGVLEGLIVFGAAQGLLVDERLPVPLPFESLAGELTFGDGSMVQVTKLDLASPLLRAQVAGSIGEAASLEAAPLDLRAEIEAEPGARELLQGAGIRMGRSGRTTLRIQGTVAGPVIR